MLEEVKRSKIFAARGKVNVCALTNFHETDCDVTSGTQRSLHRQFVNANGNWLERGSTSSMSAITRFFSHVMSKQSFNGRFLRQNGYELLDDPPLGEGSYAKVRRAYSTKLKLHVAIKIVDRKKAPDDFLKRFLPRELNIIQRLEHPHIIRVYDVMDIGDKVFVVMDIASGDLLGYIKARGFVKEDLGKKIFLQLLQAVKHCHRNGVLHRDLKCENILLDEGYNVKITDFGFAKQYNKSDLCKTFCGSAAYAAYEILKGNYLLFVSPQTISV